MNKNINNCITDYNQKGTIVLTKDSNLNPIASSDIQKLSIYCEEVDKEYIEIGDAGEKNNLLVGRFMTDVDRPQIIKNAYSEKVINILKKSELKEFISKILNLKKEFYLRRIQFNQIDKDCFVGYHLDVDSNPDYIAAGVIQLGREYVGGKYRVYQKDGSFYDYKTSYGDLILSNCKFPHEVTKVTEGERKSLVFFISAHDNENRRKR